MALNLQEVIDNLESQTDPADNFFAKLASDENQEVVDEVTSDIEASEYTDEEQEKIAEAFELGQLAAQSVSDDLEKIAVGKTGMTPETGAPMNPAIAMATNNADVNPQVLAQVMALINQAASGIGQTGSLAHGSVGGQGAAAAQAPAVTDAYPIASDAIGTPGRVKTAADYVVGGLYGLYFGGEE